LKIDEADQAELFKNMNVKEILIAQKMKNCTYEGIVIFFSD